MTGETAREIRCDFRAGRIDPEAVPRSELRRAYSQAVGGALADATSLDTPFGHAPLRSEIARMRARPAFTASARFNFSIRPDEVVD